MEKNKGQRNRMATGLHTVMGVDAGALADNAGVAMGVGIQFTTSAGALSKYVSLFLCCEWERRQMAKTTNPATGINANRAKYAPLLPSTEDTEDGAAVAVPEASTALDNNAAFGLGSGIGEGGSGDALGSSFLFSFFLLSRSLFFDLW